MPATLPVPLRPQQSKAARIRCDEQPRGRHETRLIADLLIRRLVEHSAYCIPEPAITINRRLALHPLASSLICPSLQFAICAIILLGGR